MKTYQRLKGRIKEFYGNQDDFAKELNISTTALANKLNGRTKISMEDARIMVKKLNIKPEELEAIFFEENDRKN